MCILRLLSKWISQMLKITVSLLTPVTLKGLTARIEIILVPPRTIHFSSAFITIICSRFTTMSAWSLSTTCKLLRDPAPAVIIRMIIK